MSWDTTSWARQGSNLRPLACKARALPLSYAPRPPRIGTLLRSAARGGPQQEGHHYAASFVTASFQPDCSRASPGWFTSAKAIFPSVSTRKVPRSAMPALSLKTP